MNAEVSDQHSDPGVCSGEWLKKVTDGEPSDQIPRVLRRALDGASPHLLKSMIAKMWMDTDEERGLDARRYIENVFLVEKSENEASDSDDDPPEKFEPIWTTKRATSGDSSNEPELLLPPPGYYNIVRIMTIGPIACPYVENLPDLQKKKLRTKIGRHCNETYVPTDDAQECIYHPGRSPLSRTSWCMLTPHLGEIEADTSQFSGWDEEQHGPLLTEERIKEQPMKFSWNCCDRKVDAEGCLAFEFHENNHGKCPKSFLV